MTATPSKLGDEVRALAKRIVVATNLDEPEGDEGPSPGGPDDGARDDGFAGGLWNNYPLRDLGRVLRESAAACLIETGTARPAGHEIGVLFGSDEEIAALNGEWRGKPSPTNVLSWPAEDLDQGAPAPDYLGDLAFAYGVIAREADERGAPFLDYLCVLAVHGIMHCLGHDHIDDDEAERMERTEARALARLGLPDPYRDDG